MQWKPLSKADSTLYKGVAIILIATHNFMHIVVPGHPGENEFAFRPERFERFLHLLTSEPLDILRVTLSYFGHFGVQIFIFLSAYGLAKKYLDREIFFPGFMWERITKLYPPLLLAIVVWALWISLVLHAGGGGLEGAFHVIAKNRDPLLLKLSLLSSFYPDQALKPVGPWWFFPFIMQFYLVFPLLLYVARRFGAISLLTISIASLIFLVAQQDSGFNYYFTVIGHLPEFCLGIYLARQDQLEVPNSYLIAVLVVFILGNIYLPFWYLSHFSALVLLLVAFQAILVKTKSNQYVVSGIAFIGTISMQMFLVNGFLRKPFVYWSKEYENWFLTIVFCLVSLLTTIVISYFLKVTESTLRKTTARVSRRKNG